MNVHLVDGTYELFRNWFGAPPHRGAEGREVGATVGLVRSLQAMLREPGVTHVGCAFDHVIESFRNDLFAGYKTGEGIEPELLGQFELAERAVAALGVVVWPMIEFEADDALATAAARYGDDPRVERVILCSPDKDLAQCVRGGRTVMLDRRRAVILDEEAVITKFGVPPAAIPDFLALVGDAADGIPGIRGFGARTAAALLARYGSLDAIPADGSSWDVPVRSASRLAETLAAEREAALLYRRLATLRTDVPLKETLDDLEWQGIDRAALESIAAELAAPRLLP